ncbi:2,5-diamino-6-(ribosylamino)-4(3H)-pyrimidinone 5'-phosphate reductase [Xylographa trunciseda]|nr:2,5-diamino-6-(ribosylamino)-4(3H)-pyrimidinone 5'-phosphate reductase [Xylographa trunciseda]
MSTAALDEANGIEEAQHLNDAADSVSEQNAQSGVLQSKAALPAAALGSPDLDTVLDVDSANGPVEPADESNTEELLVPKRDINDLRFPPPHLADIRWRLFEVREPIELKIDEFEHYWPYTDNVWVRQHRAGTDRSGRVTTDYYACRLQRPTYTPRKADPTRPDGKPLRKKQTREGGTCQMRIKTVRTEGACPKYSITKVGDHEHTHDLDHMDRIKRNTVVMEIARAEVMKGFMPASVFTIMSEDEEKLAAAGGRYLNRNDVRNASQAWRRTHGDQLAVHPGYKYDHGNGIVREEEVATGLLPPTTNSTDIPMLDPALASTPILPPPVPAPPLDPNTLYFPPSSQPFLTPYLPPSTPPSPLILPHITLSYATSLDSFLAIAPNTRTALSGPISKALTHYLRTRHDAILIGVGTALADDPTLNARLPSAGGYGGLGWDGQPRPIVIDPSARWVLTPQSAILQAVAAGRARAPWVIIAPGCSIDPARLELLKHYGGKYLGLPDLEKGYRLSWEAVFRALAAEGVRSLMVEGGGVVINELLQPEYARFVSSVVVTVAPTYLGTGGVVVCPTRNVDVMGRPRPVVRFRDVRWEQVGEDVVMCGKVGMVDAEGAGFGPVSGPVPVRGGEALVEDLERAARFTT